MGPKKASGGWNPAQLQAAQNVELGSKIKCLSCKKNLMQAKFSNKQLDGYRSNILRHGQIRASLPNCRTCVGTQPTEMKCSECDLTKGLDLFSKRQRKNPDNAKCMACQQEIDDRVPNVEDALEELKISEEIANGEFAPGSAYSTTASLSGLSHPGSMVGTSASGPGKKENTHAVWIPEGEPAGLGSFNFGALQKPESDTPGHRSGSISSVGSNSPSTSTASVASTPYDAFVHDRVHQSYRQGFSSNASSVNSGGRAKGPSGNFAKTGAEWRKQNPAQKVAIQHMREAQQRLEQQKSLHGAEDDDDDDDDDEEYEL